MKIGVSLGFLMCLNAGGVVAGEETPTVLEVSRVRVVDVAHIYFNLASGERVVTLMGDGQSSGAELETSPPVWSSVVRTPCADEGFATSISYMFDDNSPTSMTSLSTAITVLDYGDIEINTVVDCVHIDWVTDHDDVDADSDGIGDGVEGLAGQWTWWDADDAGSMSHSTRETLISFVLTDLPGDLDPSADVVAGYTVDVDLAGAFSSSLSFEICDTDSDPQGAAFFNAGIGNLDQDFDDLPDSDLDGDGLADFSWTVRFFQPGTADIDGDGVIDGDIADSMKPIGVYLAVPAGETINFGPVVWIWSIDTTVIDAGTGEEDRVLIYSPPDQNGNIEKIGAFGFGGFSCADNGSGGWTPAAMLEHQLFGPSGVVCCSAADLNCDGILNFFDISLFLSDFNSGGDYNNDGVTDFFDISVFLSNFLASGCA